MNFENVLKLNTHHKLTQVIGSGKLPFNIVHIQTSQYSTAQTIYHMVKVQETPNRCYHQ